MVLANNESWRAAHIHKTEVNKDSLNFDMFTQRTNKSSYSRSIWNHKSMTNQPMSEVELICHIKRAAGWIGVDVNDHRE